MSTYRKTHILAKIVVCVLVILLLLLGRYFDIFIFEVLAVIVWIFGINFIGWTIEEFAKIKHRHEKI